MTANEQLPTQLRYVADFMQDHGVGVGDHCDAPTLREAADEIERLRAGLSMIAQIIHGNTRTTCRIAESTLAGCDLRDTRDADELIDTVERIARGQWQPDRTREANPRTTNPPLSRVAELKAAIREHRSQKADDRCIEDDDRLYAVLRDGVACDRQVGCKAAMLANCARFIDRRCEGGGWPSYAELEAAVNRLQRIVSGLAERVAEQSELLSRKAEVSS